MDISPSILVHALPSGSDEHTFHGFKRTEFLRLGLGAEWSVNTHEVLKHPDVASVHVDPHSHGIGELELKAGGKVFQSLGVEDDAVLL